METDLIGGRYRLDGELGSGGMGTVWRAFDELLARPVAVKEIRFPPHTSEQEKANLNARAMTEARAAAALTHPAIVAVHDVTMHDGKPWIVMQLVPGRSLQQLVNEDGPLSVDEVTQLGLRLLGALETAHAGGVTHRDVKPSNVLVPGGGGTAMLTDFSIAKVMGYGTTNTGVPMGSAGYIAPERMLTGVTGYEGDLFCLGATLFFALEGQGPFYRSDPMVAILAAAVDPHPRPQRAGHLTALLDALLVKDPRERATLDQARGMLLRPPAADPVIAAPAVTPDAPTPFAAAAPAVLAATPTAVEPLAPPPVEPADVAPSAVTPLAPQAPPADPQLPPPLSPPASADTQMPYPPAVSAPSPMAAPQTPPAPTAAPPSAAAGEVSHAPVPPPPPIAAAQTPYAQIAPSPPMPAGQMPYAPIVSPSVAAGQMPAVPVVSAPGGGHTSAPPGLGQTAQGGRRDGDTVDDPPTTQLPPQKSKGAFSHGRASVPVSQAEQNAVDSAPSGGEPQREERRSRRGLLIVGAGALAAAAMGGTAWVLRDREAPAQSTGDNPSATPSAPSNLEVFSGHRNEIWALAWAADSKRFASASADFTVRLWTTTSATSSRVLTGHAGEVFAVQWSPDGELVATGAADNTARIWSAQTGAEEKSLPHDQAVRAVAWSPDGKLLATGCNDRKIHIWEAASGQLVRTLVGHTSAALAVAWAPNGKALASIGDLGDQAGYLLGSVIAARVWDPATGAQTLTVATGKKQASFSGARPSIVLAGLRAVNSPATTSVAWSPDSALLATGNDASTTWLWDAQTGEQLRVLGGHTDIVNAVAFKPDQALIATASADQTILLWNPGSSTVLRTFTGHTGSVNAIAFSPDGKRLLSASSDKTLRMWEAVA